MKKKILIPKVTLSDTSLMFSKKKNSIRTTTKLKSSLPVFYQFVALLKIITPWIKHHQGLSLHQ